MAALRSTNRQRYRDIKPGTRKLGNIPVVAWIGFNKGRLQYMRKAEKVDINIQLCMLGLQGLIEGLWLG